MVDIPQNKYATLQQLQSKCDFGWLCDTLIQTYNTSVLDVSDPTFKDACRKEKTKIMMIFIINIICLKN